MVERLEVNLFLLNCEVVNLTCSTVDLYTRSALVHEEEHSGRTVYLCDCGLGYDDILLAYACEEYRRTHGINSEDIIKRATYNPRTEPRTRIVSAHE